SVRVRLSLPVSLLAGVLWLLSDGSASAARHLKGTVELNDKVVLRTSFDDGNEPVPVLWRQLGEDVLWEEEAAKIDPDAADASAAKLRGALVIRIYHVDRLLVEAKADELSLKRAGPAGDRWSIPMAEVERIAQANGIPNPPSPTLFQWWAAAAGGVVV